MTDLTIDGDIFRVEIDGDPTRPALLLSNSLGTDLTMWDGQMAALTTHFRVVRYDARGHGGSALGRAPASMARLGRDALAILDALEIETAHFIGLSMGGAVGLWLLAHAPARIGRAVLANTAPKLGDADTWNARITDVLANGMEANATATVERWLTPAFASREPRTAGSIYEMLRRTSPDGYAFCCAALRDMDLRAALATIRHEVLVVTGTEDAVVPEADAAAFVAGLAGARHVSLEARHLSNVEAAAAFDAAVLAFLTAKPARRAPAKAASPKVKASAQPAASVSTSKRGGAGRRSNPARRPLKATAKRAPKKAAKPRADSRRRPPATKPRRAATAAKRAPGKAAKPLSAKTGLSKTGVSKTGAKAVTRKAAAKKKPTTTRRPTPAAAARAPVKKVKPRKTAAKKTVKPTPAAKGVAKKIPPSRRKSVTKPRRPTGRRKR